MTALYIIGGVLLLFIAILFIPIGVELRYDGEFAAALRVLFIRYRIIPKRKKKIKLRKFSKKRYERMIAREKKKAEKKAAKKAKKAAEKAQKKAEGEKAAEAKKKKRDVPKLIGDLWDMRDLIVRTVRDFVGRIRTERVKIRLVIGSDNAAKSALIYGAASNFAVEVPEILRTQTNLRRECEIALGVDFTSEETVADIEMRFALRIASVLATALVFIFGFVKHKINDK